MKNLAKIFTAVVVALVAYACTTDTTETLGVKLGGQTTLTLSIEESRTQLGEKVSGVYPVKWCEDDVVAANGVKSTVIEILGDGSAAQFTFAEDVARPYSLVYPASEATPVTAGLQAVTFLASQAYVAGSFCDGAAPMYGYADEGDENAPIQLQHLTGVLRLAVKGNGEVLKSIAVVAEGKIAGNFDVDCQTGALTAHEDASNTVNVTFEEGLTLGAEAAPIYVAVPAGEHGGITLTLTTADAKCMTLFFNSNGERSIKAATVREFKEFAFEENDAANDWFEIYTVADMLTFAKNAASFPFVGAKLMATIDMTGVEWAPIEGFSKIFDGGNENATVEGDNGICIKGLGNTMFNETSATIKNLKVEVNATTSTSLYVGGLANKLSGPVTNVLVSGLVTLTTKTTGASYIGGIAGMILPGASFTNVVNRAEVHPERNNHLPKLGGFVGCVGADFETPATFTNCHNYGDVTIDSGTGVSSKNTYMGGFIGSYASDIKLTNCSNHGDVYHGPINVKNRCIGGVIGRTDDARFHVSLNNVHNYGNVKSEGVSTENTYVGGCVGYMNLPNAAEDGTPAYHWENVTNSGTVYASGDTQHSVCVGGVAGYLFGNTTTYYRIKDVKNLAGGDVTMACNANISSTTGKLPRIGGVYGVINYIEHTNSVNLGDVTWDAAGQSTCTISLDVCVGGVAGYHRYAAAIGSKNAGDLYFNADNRKFHHHIGGCFGQISTYEYNIEECVNTGNIYLNNTFGTLRARIGGIVGVNYYSKEMINCINSGNIVYDALETSNQMYIGGIVGYVYTNNSGAVTSISGAKNKGNITVKKGTASNTAQIFIAGIYASMTKGKETSYVKDCVNVGDIDVDLDTKYTSVKVAGCVAKPMAVVPHTNLQSHATISAAGFNGSVGGIFGLARSEVVESVETLYIAKDCKVGGSVCVEQKEVTKEPVYDDEGNVLVPGGTSMEDVPVEIVGSNWFEHIYTTPVTNEVATSDGCDFLATKPVVNVPTIE